MRKLSTKRKTIKNNSAKFYLCQSSTLLKFKVIDDIGEFNYCTTRNGPTNKAALPTIPEPHSVIFCCTETIVSNLISLGLEYFLIRCPSLQLLDESSLKIDPFKEGKTYVNFSAIFDDATDEKLSTLIRAFNYLFANDYSVRLTVLLKQRINRSARESAKEQTSFFVSENISIVSGKIEENKIFQTTNIYITLDTSDHYSPYLFEATRHGCLVIAPKCGAHLDFCDNGNSILFDVDYSIHFNPLIRNTSVAPTINIDKLITSLWKAYVETPVEKHRKNKRLLAQIISKNVAVNQYFHSTIDNIPKLLSCIEQVNLMPTPFWGLITTWNTKCGIATYAHHLIDNMPKQKFFIFSPKNSIKVSEFDKSIRCWEISKESNYLDEILNYVENLNIFGMFIQFNYGFFNFDELILFIQKAKKKGLAILVELHCSSDPYPPTPNFIIKELAGALGLCDKILVHTQEDFENLGKIGLNRNVVLLPHGVITNQTSLETKYFTSNKPKYQLATFGFCLPNKGFFELAKAVELLLAEGLDVNLLILSSIYNDPSSIVEASRISNFITMEHINNRIKLVTDFLDDSVILAHLRGADMIIYPYQETKESASGSVRYALASGQPTAVTPINIFKDLGNAVYRLPGCEPDAIARGIKSFLFEIETNSRTFKEIISCASEWRDVHSYDKTGNKLSGIMNALFMNYNITNLGEIYNG